MDSNWHLEGLPTALPDLLKDEETGLAFDSCRVCELDLHHPPAPYMVEKVIRTNPVSGQRETVFAFAVCMECSEEMKSQISKESMEAISQYLAERVDFSRRLELAASNPELFEQEALSHCLVSGVNVKEEAEYQLAACCYGDQMILGIWPYALSGSTAAELGSLLSQETLGFLDDFYGQHFGMPPEWADLFRERPVFWL